MKAQIQTVFLTILVSFALYLSVAMTRFRFAHPWLTETQLALRIGDALCWRTLPP